MVSFFHDDLPSLYKLIERLLNLSENEETQILAGKLPEMFPNEIPFPSGANIIGSVVYDNDWHKRIRVCFDVSLKREQLNKFYQENLGANWNRREHFGGGFTDYLEEICFVNRTLNREFSVCIDEFNIHSIMVSLDLYQPSDFGLPFAPLPSLSSPPPNVHVLRVSGGMGKKESSTDAKLKTNLDLQELVTHYAACFEREGWLEIDSGKKENFAWRNWKMTDENNQTWSGVLQITSLAETGRYLASAHVFQ